MNKKNISPMLIIIILLVIQNFVRNGFDNPGAWFYSELVMLPGLLVGLSFHEFAHAWTSDKLGDPTPRMQGRVTLNPIAHIDPFGFVALLLAGFGWGKPVQIDPRYYKSRRRDEFLVSIAGVTMNLILAVIFTLITRLVIKMNPYGGTLVMTVLEVLQNVIVINLVLMVFNLIPIPPLDGFGIVTEIFNLRKYSWYNNIYNYGFLILFFLIMFNLLDFIMMPVLNFFWRLMMKLLVM